MFVYLMILKAYNDEVPNEKPIYDIEIFETETLAYRWVKNFFVNTTLTLLIDDKNETQKFKKNINNLTCDDIREKYFIGKYNQYKYNYSIERKWVFTSDLEKYLMTQ